MEKGSQQTRCHGDQAAAPQFPWGGTGLPPHLSQNSRGSRGWGDEEREWGGAGRADPPLSSRDKLRPRTRLLARPRGDISRGGPASDSGSRATGRCGRWAWRKMRSGPRDAYGSRCHVRRGGGRGRDPQTAWYLVSARHRAGLQGRKQWPEEQSNSVPVSREAVTQGGGRGGSPDKRSGSPSWRSRGGRPWGVRRGAL